MRKELPKLPPFAVVTEEIAHASAVERFDQQLVELSGHVGATKYVLAKRGQEDSFHRRPEPQQPIAVARRRLGEQRYRLPTRHPPRHGGVDLGNAAFSFAVDEHHALQQRALAAKKRSSDLLLGKEAHRLQGAHHGNIGGMRGKIEACVRAGRNVGNYRNQDQHFLRTEIWPVARNSVKIHDDYFDFMSPTRFSPAFALPRPMHVGQNDWVNFRWIPAAPTVP